MNFVCVCIRIPKCGSTSLVNCLMTAFAERQTFYLPHSLNLEGPISAFQRWRFHRTRARNLRRWYHTSDIVSVYKSIEKEAAEGDLIVGGHIDFSSVRQNVARKLKMIVMFRDPAERSRSEYNYCRQAYFRKQAMSRFDATIMHKTAGRCDFDAYLDFMLDHAPAYANLAARYIGWDGNEDLSRLFARDVFHSGVLERSDVFARALVEKLQRPVSFPHDNRTGKNRVRHFTSAQRRKVEQLYPLDFALYEWQLAHLGEGISARSGASVDAAA
jgi:Sulfotransferase family